MSRLIPKSFYTDNHIEPPKPQGKSTKRTPKELAIERNTQRLNALKYFCEKYDIDYNHNLCKLIRKCFSNPATKNIPIAEYKKELNIIGGSINSGDFSIDEMTKIMNNNVTKGYKYLIYENQLQKTHYESYKPKSKDNISLESQKNVKEITLKDFDDYREYLENPNSDIELMEFVRMKLGVNI